MSEDKKEIIKQNRYFEIEKTENQRIIIDMYFASLFQLKNFLTTLDTSNNPNIYINNGVFEIDAEIDELIKSGGEIQKALREGNVPTIRVKNFMDQHTDLLVKISSFLNRAEVYMKATGKTDSLILEKISRMKLLIEDL